MKQILSLSILLSLGLASAIPAEASLEEHSNFQQTMPRRRWNFPFEKGEGGYYFGRLLKTSREGWPFKSIESQMQVGDVGGNLSAYRDEPPKGVYLGENGAGPDGWSSDEQRRDWERRNRVAVTPWNFSALSMQVDELDGVVNELVMIHYFKRYIRDPFLKTRYEYVTAMRPRSANFSPLSYEVNRGAHNALSNTHMFGRIVKIAFQGSPIIKTWELVVQEGEHGRAFQLMSIRDRTLARYAIMCMQSNTLVRLDYSMVGVPVIDQLSRVWGERNPLAVFRFQESKKDIYRISQELIPQANPNDLEVIPDEVFTGESNLDVYMKTKLGG